MSRLRSVAERPCAADVATTYSLAGSSFPAGTVRVVVNAPARTCCGITQPWASQPLATSGPLPSQIEASPRSTYAPFAAPAPTKPVPEIVNVFSTAGSTGADGETVTFGSTAGSGSGSGSGSAAVTECTTPADVEATKAAGSAGSKVALSSCAPAARLAVSRRATPSATGAVPSTALPSRNATVPAAAGATVAASVTVVPATEVPAGVTASVVVVACAGDAGSGDSTRAVSVAIGLPAYDEK